MNLSWETIKDFVVAFGWAKGTLTILFWVFHIWIYRLYNARLEDKQKEIDRLIRDNIEYRERFHALLDRAFSYQKKPEPTALPDKKPDDDQ